MNLVELWVNFDTRGIFMVPHGLQVGFNRELLRYYGQIKNDAKCWKCVCIFPAGMDPIAFCLPEERAYIDMHLSLLKKHAMDDLVRDNS